ncbi:hypothetical protein ACILE9_03980 [Capnocytophaga cynodegmi]|uniref:hypothetical protein n=1 Tax=Capnocytophaga cynodegmi TaxID=28189 RepID=UPI0037D6F211
MANFVKNYPTAPPNAHPNSPRTNKMDLYIAKYITNQDGIFPCRSRQGSFFVILDE